MTTNANDRAGVFRVVWAVIGGTMGASLGVGGYGNLSQNADGFGTMLAQGFFLVVTCVGLVTGIALGILIGRAVEAMLRRLGATPAVALGVATVVTVLMLALFRNRVLEQYPGFHAGHRANRHANAAQTVAIAPAAPAPVHPIAMIVSETRARAADG